MNSWKPLPQAALQLPTLPAYASQMMVSRPSESKPYSTAAATARVITPRPRAQGLSAKPTLAAP